MLLLQNKGLLTPVGRQPLYTKFILVKKATDSEITPANQVQYASSPSVCRSHLIEAIFRHRKSPRRRQWSEFPDLWLWSLHFQAPEEYSSNKHILVSRNRIFIPQMFLPARNVLWAHTCSSSSSLPRTLQLAICLVLKLTQAMELSKILDMT